MKLYACFCLFWAILVLTPQLIMDPDVDYPRLTQVYPRLTYAEWSLIYANVNYQNTKYVPIRAVITVDEICAIIQRESEYFPDKIHLNYRNGVVVSIDHGLMMYNSENEQGKRPDIMELPVNIRLGISYYTYCKYRARGNSELAYKMYNAGTNRKEYINQSYADYVMQWERKATIAKNSYYMQLKKIAHDYN